MTDVCSELRVIDLSSGPAAGIATMILADYGADVLKIERPGGDPLRRLPASPMWLRGKRSAELDLKTADGRECLHELARSADIVVASYRPGAAEPLGADYETLSALNPGLVYCSLTGWGPDGPYAHYPPYEGLVAAKSGRMLSFAGQPRREGPAYAAVQVGTHAAAQAALSGVLAALLARDRDGLGQLVETSLLQGMFPYDLFGLVREQLTRRYPHQFEGDPFAAHALMPMLQYQPVMAGDGRWIQLANLLEHHFHACMVQLGITDIYGDPRFEGVPGRLDDEAREELRNRMLREIQAHDVDEWMERFRADGQIASEPVQSTQDGLWHRDAEPNGEVGSHDHPRLGPIRQLGRLARLGETPSGIAGPAPEVGQHTDELRSQPWEPRPAAVAGTAGWGADQPPLEGITIVEFATIIAAPLGTAFLADLGARVIKVEPPAGDPYRGMGAGLGAWIGSSKTTAGKESICLDLRRSEGQQIAHRFLRQADMVLHNFRPGVPERLGIGYEQVRALRPDIVYVEAGGYGRLGPSAHRPAAHPIPGAAMGGQLYQSGAAVPPERAETLEERREVSRWLARANEANPDPNTGSVVMSAALLGLYARSRTGEGQHVNVSMMGANAYANADDYLHYEGKQPRPVVDAELYGIHALYRLYPARSGWVFLAVVTDAEWDAFCDTTGQEAWRADPRFATRDARREHDRELCEAVAQLLAARDAAEWERLLTARGVGCVRADGASPGAFFLDDEQIEANGWAIEAEHAIWGRARRWGPQVVLRRTPGRFGPGALAGQHADALLAEFGYDADEIASLRGEGIVRSEELFDPAVTTPESPGF